MKRRWTWPELAAALAKADSEEERARLISTLTYADALDFDVKFEAWAHANQLPPNGEGWSTWLMQAGRGFGKTRAGAEWIFGLAQARPGARIALVGASLIEARSIMVEGVSGLLSIARNRKRRVKWEPSVGRLVWPNGSEAQIFSGDHPDGLRGPEHDFAWCPPSRRLRHCPMRRGGGDQCAAGGPGRWPSMGHRPNSDWRMGWQGRSCCHDDCGRLAVRCSL